MSKVDILMPAYNAAHFLPAAIESVLAQTEPDWHILLVDDGSSDGTGEFVASYLRENFDRIAGRLTYIVQQNMGLPAARNTGIRAGHAPYIALLDADDRWLPTRLAMSLQSFQNAPQVGLSYGGITRFRDDGEVIDTFTESDPGRTREQVATRLYTRAVHFPCPTVTFRRDCLQVTGLFDETMRATEDRDLWLRIAQHFDVTFVPHVLALYRVSAGSMSADLPRMLTAQRQFIAKHRGETGCGWGAAHNATAGALMQQAHGYSTRGKHSSALRYAGEAVLSAPWLRETWRNAATTMAAALRR